MSMLVLLSLLCVVQLSTPLDVRCRGMIDDICFFFHKVKNRVYTLKNGREKIKKFEKNSLCR
jgi:hypothetical protein